MKRVPPPTDLDPRVVDCNRLGALSRIADDISHEIKNPLHAMVINLELVKRRVVTGAGEAALERVAIVEEEIQRVHRLMDTLLRLLRPTRESLGAADVGVVVEDLLPVLEAEANVQRLDFRYVPGRSTAPVRIARSSLSHALLNLFLNSVESLGEGGGGIALEIGAAPKSVHLRVSDTGPALPEQTVSRLGEVGFTTRPGHEGRGLAVAAWLAQQAGGELRHEPASEASEGVTFTLVFPRHDPT